MDAPELGPSGPGTRSRSRIRDRDAVGVPGMVSGVTENDPQESSHVHSHESPAGAVGGGFGAATELPTRCELQSGPARVRSAVLGSTCEATLDPRKSEPTCANSVVPSGTYEATLDYNLTCLGRANAREHGGAPHLAHGAVLP